MWEGTPRYCTAAARALAAVGGTAALLGSSFGPVGQWRCLCGAEVSRMLRYSQLQLSGCRLAAGAQEIGCLGDGL